MDQPTNSSSAPLDETEGWIFTDEAHIWIERSYRKHGYINPAIRTAGGYEYGLFGFKDNTCADINGQCGHGPDMNFIYAVRFEHIRLGDEKRML